MKNQVDNLIELGSEKVQTSQDGAVRAQLVGLHHILVLDRVPNVYIARVGDFKNGWVKVHVVGSLAMLAQVRDQSLQQII